MLCLRGVRDVEDDTHYTGVFHANLVVTTAQYASTWCVPRCEYPRQDTTHRRIRVPPSRR